MSSQKWLNCRLADVQDRLDHQGHGVSRPVISRLLKKHNYRLRVNVKQVDRKQHPDRDRQFRYLREQRTQHQAAGQPAISVDTKKKELIGNFKNPGQTWGQSAERVNVHDFRTDAVGRAVPYGIYDMTHNCGTVYVGQSADTPAFAVDNIARWCAPTRRGAAFPHGDQSDDRGRCGWQQQRQLAALETAPAREGCRPLWPHGDGLPLSHRCVQMEPD